jgi:hypothetical protein
MLVLLYAILVLSVTIGISHIKTGMHHRLFHALKEHQQKEEWYTEKFEGEFDFVHV